MPLGIYLFNFGHFIPLLSVFLLKSVYVLSLVTRKSAVINLLLDVTNSKSSLLLFLSSSVGLLQRLQWPRGKIAQLQVSLRGKPVLTASRSEGSQLKVLQDWLEIHFSLNYPSSILLMCSIIHTGIS